MNNQLQWEIDWINTNSFRYDSPLHVKAVIGNITKRYSANETKRLFKILEEAKTNDESLIAYQNLKTHLE